MIAACIPVLRILVRDITSTVRGYGAPNSTVKMQTLNSGHGWKVDATGEIKVGPISTTQKVARGDDDRSDRSDKSILNDSTIVREGWIVRTEEVAIDYRIRGPGDSRSNDFGLGFDRV